MPYRDESKLTGDAPASVATQLSFDPMNGPFDGESTASTVTGTLETKFDEDWIVIELTEGKTYTITLKGSRKDNSDVDTVLKIHDSKGGVISNWMNDDVNGGGDGKLWSEVKVTPPAGSGTQKYHISVSAYTGNPADDANFGSYTVTVKEMGLPGSIGPGEDKPVKLTGTAAGEELTGGSKNDVIDGRGGNDVIDGKGGDDVLIGGPGADNIKGGPGESDTVSYKHSPEGVSVNLFSGAARGGDAQGDTLADDIENVEGSMYDDVLVGSDGPSMLWGLAGDDSLDGDEDDDVLEGGPGADDLVGGSETDTASYASSSAGVTVRLHARQAMGGDAEGDTFAELETAKYFDKDGDPVEERVPDIENLTGSSHRDVLAGDSRDNVLKGGGGNDSLYGGPGGGNDEMYGGIGDDRIYGGEGNDELMGGDGDDLLNGGRGRDVFDGGKGDDLIYADGNDRRIAGGEGEDTVSYEKLEKTPGAKTINSGNMAGIENIIGSQDDDTITGDRGDNVIEGGEGGDTLKTGGGVDTLSYAGSDDWVRVTLGSTASGSETVTTASRGHASGDTFMTGAEGTLGTDTNIRFRNIQGSRYNDDLTGNEEANVLMGGSGDDDLVGGLGSDTIVGGPGADELDGGVSRATDQETGANKDLGDWLSYEGSSEGVTVNLAASVVAGGDAAGDRIATVETDHDDDDDTDEIEVSTFENARGSDHDDSLTGDYRDNTLEGGAGADTLDGGAGNDTASYANATAGVEVDLASNRGRGGEAAGDRYSSIEMFEGSGKDDAFIAGKGYDAVDGGGGYDTMSYEKSRRGVKVDMDKLGSPTTAAPQDYVGAWRYLADNIEMFYVDGSNSGGNTGNTNTSGERDDHETGFDDMDVLLKALNGQTTGINAGDIKIADDTKDSNNADIADIVLTDKLSNGPDNTTAPGYSIGGGELDELRDLYGTNADHRNNYVKGDRLDDVENVTGSDYDDTIIGNSATPPADDTNTTEVDESKVVGNTLVGGAGRDDIEGAAGNDVLRGGDGDDDLDGKAADDTLDGGAGYDVLIGGAGNDRLDGGFGDDNLTGGGGNDTFIFSPADKNALDTIVDFTRSGQNDRIDLSEFNLTADELKDLMTLRGGNTVIDLSDHGGGDIVVNDVADLDFWDIETTTNNAIDTLSIARDYNGDGDYDDALDEGTDGKDYNGDGDMTDSLTEDGIFIL